MSARPAFDLRQRQVIHRLAERLWEQHGHPGQPCEIGPRGLGFCAWAEADPCPECFPDRPDARVRYRCAAHRDPSQTSTGVDDVPNERASDDPAQIPAVPTDLAASAPDHAADVAGTTGGAT